jgi:hypothetical protein
MKKYLALGVFMALVFSVGFVIAAKPEFTPKSTGEMNLPKGRAPVTIPAHAQEVAPGVFYLGTAMDHGRVVEGYAIVHYKKGLGKPGSDTNSCYKFLAKGAKWKAVEDWVVNPSNDRELNEDFVIANLKSDIAKWEVAAGVDILGRGSSTIATLVADTVSPDGQNEAYFGSIDEPGAIAVTIMWGYFGGPPPFRELVEWDQVYDDMDFDWSATGEADKMDFENIATHELGHSVGLGDLYTDECSEQTMYGYAGYGETIKRDLADGDIAGIQKLYS